MNCIEYHPFRTLAWVCAVCFPISVGWLIIVGTQIERMGEHFFYLALVAAFSLWLTIFSFNRSFTTLYLNVEGILLIEGRKHCAKHFRWEEIPYRYPCKNCKGFTFWVCSPSELDEKQVRHYMNRAANRSKVYLAPVVVIPIDHLQAISQQIENTVSNAEKGL